MRKVRPEGSRRSMHACKRTEAQGDVDKLRGTFICHRGSLDFDFKFICEVEAASSVIPGKPENTEQDDDQLSSAVKRVSIVR